MRLAVEKDVKLPGLKTVKGFDLVIPRVKDVPRYAHGKERPLLWEQLRVSV